MAETQFVIPARNLKVFSKIVQCMAKIGDDLFFDVTTDKVFALCPALQILRSLTPFFEVNYAHLKQWKVRICINSIQQELL
jgi:hypothetical protein